MRVFARLIATAVATTIIALSTTALALGAPATWQVVDVTVHHEQGSSVMLVSGTLPAGTKLPADVELAVPSGGQFQWAGEILGGPVEQDPDVQYKVTTRDGMDIYSFRMSKALTGQVEIVRQDLVSSTADGFQTNLAWTAGADVPELRMSVRIPQTSKVTVPAAGAEIGEGPPGYSYYNKTIKNVKAGQTETLSFGYSAPTATSTSSGAGAAGGSNSFVPVLIFVIAAGVFIVIGRNVMQKMNAKRDAEMEAATPSKPAKSARAARAQESAFGDESEEQVLVSEPSTKKNPALIMAVVIGALGIAAVFALSNGGKATVQGNEVRLEIAPVDACTSASVPLATPQGGDLKRDANAVLSRLKSVPGVGSATIYVSESRMQVEYCSSSTSEESIRAALIPSGYVSATTLIQSAPAGAAPASTGGS